MYSKEQFNWVWKDTSREGILNQFYYDHLEMEKYKNIINDLENYILNHYIVGHTIQNASLDDILNKLKELKENNK